MLKSIIGTLILCSLFCLQASAFRLAATPVFPSLLDDTVLKQPSTRAIVPAAAKKQGFFSRIKNTLLFSVLKKGALKQGADAKQILGLAALGLVVVGLGVPLLTGTGGLLLLVPLGLVAGIVSLFIKNKPDGNAAANGEPKKRKRNTAAIVAIIISGGLLLLFGALAIAFKSGRWG